jgi:protein SCO1/2
MKWCTLLTVVLLLALPALAWAEDEVRAPGTPVTQMRPQVGVPKKFAKATIEQKLDAEVPLDLTFKDEAGQDVKLGHYFNGRPVLLVIAYYRCPSLCNEVLNGLVDRLKLMWRYQPARNYEIVTVSFDPLDTPELARQKKAVYVEALGKPGADLGWHFLTGQKPEIDALCRAVGFGYDWDEEKKQYLHSSGVIVVTPGGRVSKYLLGLAFSEENLRDAIEEANKGNIGSLARSLLLFCGLYDGNAGKIVYRVVQILGALFAIPAAVCIFWQLRNLYRRRDGTLGERGA